MPAALDRLSRKLLLDRLARLSSGRLVVTDGAESLQFGPGPQPAARLIVRDPGFYQAIVLGGHLGAVDAYLDGWWDTDDLTALVRVMVQNRDVLDSLETGWARLASPVRRAWHAWRRNSRAGRKSSSFTRRAWRNWAKWRPESRMN